VLTPAHLQRTQPQKLQLAQGMESAKARQLSLDSYIGQVCPVHVPAAAAGEALTVGWCVCAG
jgi:hypothetical protein